MLVTRRTLLTLASRQLTHKCHGPACPHCIRAISPIIMRTFAAKSAARAPESARDYPLSRLARPLAEELSYQNNLIQDNEKDFDMSRVEERYAKLLKENDASIEVHGAEGRITWVKGDHKYTINFDVAEVANAVNNNEEVEAARQEEFEEEEEDEESMAERDEYEEDFEEDNEGIEPFGLYAEIARVDAAADAAKLQMELEVMPSEDEKSAGYEVYVHDFSLSRSPADSAKETVPEYKGPSFVSLDDGIREGVEQFASKNFRKFVPLIADYSRAKEANLYAGWLEEVSAFVDGKHN